MKLTHVVTALTLVITSAIPALAQTATPATSDTPAQAVQNGMDGMTAVKGKTSASGKADAAVDIESDTMEILETDKRAIFKGNVDAVRRGQHMKSDEMIVFYADVKQPDGTTKTDVQTMDSKGNVVITTNTQTITGDWSKLNVVADTLEVGGNVKVVQGKTILTGQHLDVDLKTDRTVMTGGRVKGSFIPNQK